MPETCHDDFHSHFCTNCLVCLFSDGPCRVPEEVGEFPPGPQRGEAGGRGGNQGAGGGVCVRSESLPPRLPPTPPPSRGCREVLRSSPVTPSVNRLLPLVPSASEPQGSQSPRSGHLLQEEGTGSGAARWVWHCWRRFKVKPQGWHPWLLAVQPWPSPFSQ